MKVTSIIFLLVFLVSCGQGNRKPATEALLGSSLSTGGSYSAEEKNVAIRICYAFRSKNTNFRGNLIDSKFKFNVSEKDCEGEVSNSTIDTVLKAPLASQPMIFDSGSRSAYYTEVQTDQHGPLDSICSALLKGGDPLKTILRGNDLIEISFFTSDLDNIIVRTAEKTGSNYIVNKEERFQVNTDAGAGNGLGVVSLSTREKQCSNGKVESFSQQLISN